MIITNFQKLPIILTEWKKFSVADILNRFPTQRELELYQWKSKILPLEIVVQDWFLLIKTNLCNT